MSLTAALFPSLLDSTDWSQLSPVVQRMHAEGNIIRASGKADVDGETHMAARLLRRLLSLPEPSPGQTIALTIERHATHERWNRQFRRGRMCSTLRAGKGGQLHERLGPASLCFSLRRDGDAIEWQLLGVRLFGLPLLGRLVTYRGWLEIDDVT